MADETKKPPKLPDPRVYVLKLLARREYSVGQMRRKLNTRGFEPTVVSAQIKELLKEGLLNDERFARNVVDYTLRHKPAGRAYLVAYLRKKLISRELAVDIVDGILNQTDETELAERLLRIRWRYFSKFEVETARRKAYNYLSRRSIGYGAAKSAFDKLLKEENE